MRWGWLFLLASCDDHLFMPHGGGGGGGGEDGGWCGVLASNCLGCHSAAASIGGLDLETDPYAALVDVPSSYGPVLVVPGDPDASFLLAKLEGRQGDQGTVMPPTGSLSDELIGVIRQWVADGAPAGCEATTTNPGGTYGIHPPDWPVPINHGTAAKLATLACATAGCHGATLQGEAGPSCGSCHDPLLPAELALESWTQWCTFCHGDRASDNPAPPQDIDDNQPNDISFPGHLAHVQATPLHVPFDCKECHQKPTDVFSPEHLQFGGDTSAGVAEVQFLAGALSEGGDYQGGSCGVYCHSPEPGSNRRVAIDENVQCGTCHGVLSNEDSWRNRLSEPHEKHIDEDIVCAECHANVNGQGTAVLDVALHVNGSVQVDLPGTMQPFNGTCTGTCHGEAHNGRTWGGRGDDNGTDDDGTDDD